MKFANESVFFGEWQEDLRKGYGEMKNKLNNSIYRG